MRNERHGSGLFERAKPMTGAQPKPLFGKGSGSSGRLWSRMAMTAANPRSAMRDLSDIHSHNESANCSRLKGMSASSPNCLMLRFTRAAAKARFADIPIKKKTSSPNVDQQLGCCSEFRQIVRSSSEQNLSNPKFSDSGSVRCRPPSWQPTPVFHVLLV